MKALIDADIFLYEFGSATDSEFKPLAWPFVQSRIQGRINGILDSTGCNEYQLFITSDDESNFRYEVATIKPYKGNRKGLDKPFWYQRIRDFLVERRGAIEVFNMEADDAISLEMYKNYYEKRELSEKTGQVHLPDVVCCSRDKDLRMVPGWHYSWGVAGQSEKPLYMVTKVEGLRSFYKQLLTGDIVDNIPGLYGVGKKSSHLAAIDELYTEEEMYDLVYSQYEARFGTYADLFLQENARLLWMSEKEPDDWSSPLK